MSLCRLKHWPICVAWAVLVIYCEWISPKRAVSRCKWPAIESKSTRIALVADPQLVDAHTYPGRPKFFEAVTEIVTDRYLAKNWRFINTQLDPDAIVFLGDLFDGGRGWQTPEWLEEYQRFNAIFPKPNQKKTSMSLPGNHDIGFGDTIVPEALSRFKAWFGETSQLIDIGGHNIVLLDTISMSNTKDHLISEPHFEFMQNIPNLKEPGAIYMCSHVPLFRPKGSGCGRYRESERELPFQVGHQYLTQVTPELTQEILETVQPTVIFSGDDHDACHVVHNYTVNGKQMQAHEFTVKSMSMAMGIASPGFQLLTINPDGYETAICLQGHPFRPVLVYGLAAGATVAYLFMSLRTLHSYLPITELKDKKLPNTRPLPRELLWAVGMCAVTFFAVQWYIGWWMYAPLE